MTNSTPDANEKIRTEGNVIVKAPVMKKLIKITLVFVTAVILLLALLATIGANNAGDTTLKPIGNDGTAKDSKTGLIWMRCSIGQSWGNGTCTGGSQNFSFAEAVTFVEQLNKSGGYAGATNWRLPTLFELQALRQCPNELRKVSTTPTALERTQGIKSTSSIAMVKINDESSKTIKEAPISCEEWKNGDDPKLVGYAKMNYEIFPKQVGLTWWSSTTFSESEVGVVDFYTGTIKTIDLKELRVNQNNNLVRLVRQS
jgi:hypothetical protein